MRLLGMRRFQGLEGDHPCVLKEKETALKKDGGNVPNQCTGSRGVPLHASSRSCPPSPRMGGERRRIDGKEDDPYQMGRRRPDGHGAEGKKTTTRVRTSSETAGGITILSQKELRV